MKPSDLVKLIEVCGKSGVSKLEYGELKVNFGETESQPVVPSWPNTWPSTSDDLIIRTTADGTSPKEFNDNIDSLEDMDELMMAIDDPSEWKRRGLEGDSGGNEEAFNA